MTAPFVTKTAAHGVSVIIPALNAAAYLRDSLASLARQEDDDVEAVLVDGGSDDETLEIAAAAPGLRVVSAPGTSIYEALNRGISETCAQAIVFLNADDILLPGAIEAWRDALERAPECGIVRGRATFVKIGAAGERVAWTRANSLGACPLTAEALLRGPGVINSLCIRRSVFEKIGPFDTRYRLAADRDWMLRAFKAGVRIAEFDRPVYRYLSHSGSTTFDEARRNYVVIREEHLDIATRNLSKADVDGPGLALALRRWLAVETGMLAWRRAHALEVNQLASTLARATRLDASWPLTLISETIRWLMRRLRELAVLGRFSPR
jgi:glycosyltransferase involved in cell wall biosynthesis